MVQTIIARPPGGSLPKQKDSVVISDTSGPVFTVSKLLGSSSVLSLVSASTHTNLMLVDGKIIAAVGIGDGVSQTAVVRETLGSGALEYPVIIKGKSTVTPSTDKVKAKSFPPLSASPLTTVAGPSTGVGQSVGNQQMFVEGKVAGDTAFNFTVGCHLANVKTTGLKISAQNAGIAYLVLGTSRVLIQSSNGNSILGYGRNIQRGDKIKFGINKSGLSYFFNDALRLFIPYDDTDWTDGNGTSMATIIDGILNDSDATASGVYVDYGGEGVTDINTGEFLAVPPPVKINTLSVDPVTRKLKGTVTYYTTAPTEIQLQVEDVNGIFSGYANMKVTANGTAGIASVESVGPLPLSRQGSFITARVRLGNAQSENSALLIEYPMVNGTPNIPAVDQTPVPFSSVGAKQFATSANRVVDVESVFQIVEFEVTSSNWQILVGSSAGRTTGVGYQGGSETNAFFCYTDGSGGVVSGYQIGYPNGNIAQPGGKIQVALDRNRQLTLFINGVLAPNSLIDLSTNAAVFGNLIDISITGGEFRNVVAGSFAEPITQGLQPPSINRAGQVEWDILWDGAPKAFVQQVENSTDNSVVSAWDPVIMTANTSGRGEVVGKYISARGGSYRYKLAPQNSDGTPNLSKVLSTTLIRPDKTSVGQGVDQLKYTNKLVGARMFGEGGDFFSGNPDQSSSPTPAQVSDRGDPIRPMTYFVPLDEIFGEVTWEMGCESGDLPTNIGWNGAINFRDYHQVDGNPRRVQFTFDIDRRLNDTMIMQVNTLGANPPVGLYVIKKGADLTKRFDVDWMAEMALIDGAGRHMDTINANNPYLFNLIFDYATNWQTFEHRPRIYRIGRQLHGVPLEDFVLFHNQLNTAILINANMTWGYDYFDTNGNLKTGTGRDYWRKAVKLLFEGVGSDLGEGVKLHSNKRHIIEPGNENWNFGLGSYNFLKQMYEKKNPGSSTGENAKVQAERTFAYANIIEIAEANITNWQTRIDRCFGLQMGGSDLSNVKGAPDWNRANLHIDSYAKAPYLPGDPTAGFAAGQQPADSSPESIVAWLRTYLRNNRRTIEKDVQAALVEGRICHIYEWNIAIPAIYDRSKDIERALKKSDVFFKFCRDEYMPQCILNTGGQTCVYKNQGSPQNQGQETWYAFEGAEEWAGNGLWNAMKYWVVQLRN